MQLRLAWRSCQLLEQRLQSQGQHDIARVSKKRSKTLTVDEGEFYIDAT